MKPLLLLLIAAAAAFPQTLRQQADRAGILALGKTDVRVILWPSSIVITVGWCTTAAGIMTTISSIAINCLLYVGIALLLRRCFQWISGVRSA